MLNLLRATNENSKVSHLLILHALHGLHKDQKGMNGLPTQTVFCIRKGKKSNEH